MHRKIFRQVLCIILSFLIFGCRGAYNLNLHSEPSGVTVQVGPDVQGRTPCNLAIPKNSDLIRHHRIDVKYTLENGREIIKTYNLRNYEPPNEAASFGASIFAVPGVLLLSLTESSEDDQYTSFDKEDSNSDDLKVILVGLGLIALGGLAYVILGGDINAQSEYDIHETFEDVNNIPIQ